MTGGGGFQIFPAFWHVGAEIHAPEANYSDPITDRLVKCQKSELLR